MDRHLGGQFLYAPFFWPAIATASAIETASSMTAYFLGLANDEPTVDEPQGATPSTIALELPTARLHAFTLVDSGVPTRLCTTLARHAAALGDLAEGQRLVGV